MGGTLHLESTYGSGTTAILSIPVKAVDVEIEIDEPSSSDLDSPISPMSRKTKSVDFSNEEPVVTSPVIEERCKSPEPVQRRMRLRRVQTSTPPRVARRPSVFPSSPANSVDGDVNEVSGDARKAVTVLIVEDK